VFSHLPICSFLLPAGPWSLQLREAVCFSRKDARPDLKRCEPAVMTLLLTHCLTLVESLTLSLSFSSANWGECFPCLPPNDVGMS